MSVFIFMTFCILIIPPPPDAFVKHNFYAFFKNASFPQFLAEITGVGGGYAIIREQKEEYG